MPYAFFPITLRAQCLTVIDGDTVDVLIDCGFHTFARMRVCLLGVDTPELHSPDSFERAKAVEAKEWMRAMLKPMQVRDVALLRMWPLKIVTQKDPDNFGRWLADIWTYLGEPAEEVHVNQRLLEMGLASPYLRRPR